MGRGGEGSTAEVNLEVTTVISKHVCPGKRRGQGGGGGVGADVGVGR